MSDGEEDEDDLVVLLSENTAKGLYRKWIDTLEVGVACRRDYGDCACVFRDFRQKRLNICFLKVSEKKEREREWLIASW